MKQYTLEPIHFETGHFDLEVLALALFGASIYNG